MHAGRFVFSQLMEHLPAKTFCRCVQRYGGNRRVQSFRCLDQFPCMAFAQLTHRESLRDIEVCLRAHQEKLYHMGLRGGVSRKTLSNANRRRDWRIYTDFAQALIRIARPLYADEDLGLDLDNTVYALDASTVDLCLPVFPWALFRSTKSGVKLHTLLDLRGSIPAFVHVSDAKLGDVTVLDMLIPEPGAFYVMDRAYIDFARLSLLDGAGAFFVVRVKSNTRYRRRYSHAVDKSEGLRCDQTVVLTGTRTDAAYSRPMRRVGYFQMDQAAPAHQEVLRHLSERCEIANLGGGIGIRSCGHHQKAARSGCLALHIVTGVFSHFVRENAVKQRLFRNQLHFREDHAF